MKTLYVTSTAFAFFCALLLPTIASNAQNCDSSVPFYQVNLVGQPNGSWISPAFSRQGNCCNTVSPDRCASFEVLLDSQAAMVNFNIASGAIPTGSMFYQIECGPPTPVGQPICVVGQGPHHLTFCKPGNNQNTYIITSIPKPIFPHNVQVRIGCVKNITVLGLDTSTVVWNSIYPGSPGQYNSYLSCTSNCTNPLYNPAVNAPPYVDYKVCGLPTASPCGYSYVCDTIRIYNILPLSATVSPANATFCQNGPGVLLTATASGGDGNYIYIWRNPQNVIVGNNSTYLAASAGIYTLEVRDGLYNISQCPALFLSVPVTVTSEPVVNAGSDQTICASNPTAYLSGSVQYALSGTWSGGAGTFNPSNTSLITAYTPTPAEVLSGSVTLVLTSIGAGGGCSNKSDTIKLFYPPKLVVTLPPQSLSCSSNTTAINPVINGGVSPYSYSWSNGATASSITAGQGNYCLTVTDLIGCTASACVNVTAPAALNIAMSSTDVTVNGGNNGTATASVSGGTSPYTYLWSNGQTTQTATQLVYGIYSVVVTDTKGCTIASSVVVNEPRCLSLQSNTTATSITCYGYLTGTTTATVSGGTSPYTYSWNTNPAQTTAMATGLGAGNYLVIVTDQNGCIDAVSAVVTQPSQLVNTMNLTNVSTIGGNDGSATANPAGGTPGYTYSWSNSATTAAISNLVTGVYSVTIIDSKGCTKIDSVFITQPPCNNLALGVYFTAVSCSGGNNGSATAIAMFGTPPYTYLWSNSQTTQSISNLPAGNYAVTVNDAINCSQFLNITVTQPQPLSLVLAPTNVSCNSLVNGTIELTVNGGTFPYSYNWSNNINVEDQYNLGAGTYSVTVTDNNGCTASAASVVTQPQPITMTYSKTDVLCNGGSNGSVNVNVSGGTLPYSYLWSNGATTPNISGLASGQYLLTVTDANGCNNFSAQLSVLIDEPLVVGVASVMKSCPVPNSGVAQVLVSPTGGNGGPYQVSYDNGNTFNPLGNYSTYLPVDSTYYVIVKDSNGCVSAAYPVAINPEVTAANIAFATCFSSGTSVTAVTVTPTGGNGGPYQVSFDNGNSFGPVGNYMQNLPIDSAYNVVVRDSLGCISAAYAIVIPDTLDLQTVLSSYSGGYNITCNGSSDGFAIANVNGGTGPYTYLWSTGATPQMITNIPSGNYSVVITDSNGCTKTTSVALTEAAVLSASSVVTSNYNGYAVSCNGSVNGTVDLTVSGGVTAYSYLWSNGTTTEDLSGVGAGTYTVTITDMNGCTTTNFVTLSEPQVIALGSTVQNVLCNGFGTGVINLSVSGGAGPFAYAWSNSATSQNISGLTAGSYSVTVTDANGCTQSYAASVIELSPVLLNDNSINSTCYRSNDGSIALNVTGGTAPYTYNWSNGATTQNLSGLAAGTYIVTVMDANQCSRNDTIVITQPDSLYALLNSPLTSAGYNVSHYQSSDGSIALAVSGGTSPYTYLWSNGATTQNLSGVPAGDYTVVITDSHGCTYRAVIHLSEPLGLQMPTGYSPNGDGFNDYFVVHGLDAYPDNNLKVFNRWGNKVYEKDNYQNKWDGRNSSGDPLPDGTYFVVLTINGGDIKLHGYVDIRK